MITKSNYYVLIGLTAAAVDRVLTVLELEVEPE